MLVKILYRMEHVIGTCIETLHMEQDKMLAENCF